MFWECVWVGFDLSFGSSSFCVGWNRHGWNGEFCDYYLFIFIVSKKIYTCFYLWYLRMHLMFSIDCYAIIVLGPWNEYKFDITGNWWSRQDAPKEYERYKGNRTYRDEYRKATIRSWKSVGIIILFKIRDNVYHIWLTMMLYEM